MPININSVQYLFQDSKTLPLELSITSWLIWAQIECMMHVTCLKRPINQFKPVQQSNQQVLRAYCPNIYCGKRCPLTSTLCKKPRWLLLFFVYLRFDFVISYLIFNNTFFCLFQVENMLSICCESISYFPFAINLMVQNWNKQIFLILLKYRL